MLSYQPPSTRRDNAEFYGVGRGNSGGFLLLCSGIYMHVCKKKEKT